MPNFLSFCSNARALGYDIFLSAEPGVILLERDGKHTEARVVGNRVQVRPQDSAASDDTLHALDFSFG